MAKQFPQLTATTTTQKILLAILQNQGDISVDTGDIVVNTEDIENLLRGVGGTERTPSFTINTNTTGTVAAGAYKASFYNTGLVNAQVLGTVLEPNDSVTFEVRDADTLGAIAWIATGATATLTITTLT